MVSTHNVIDVHKVHLVLLDKIESLVQFLPHRCCYIHSTRTLSEAPNKEKSTDEQESRKKILINVKSFLQQLNVTISRKTK